MLQLVQASAVSRRERSQFRFLYRDFLFRIVDLELLASRGDAQRLLSQFGALLAAFSFTFAIYFVPRYGLSTLPWEKLSKLGWVDQDLLIATTMAIAGMFTILAWNNVLPDRRDCLIFGLLPVRTRTIFLAKLAALATALMGGAIRPQPDPHSRITIGGRASAAPSSNVIRTSCGGLTNPSHRSCQRGSSAGDFAPK